MQRAFHNRLRHVQHVAQLQSGGQLGIESLAVVVEADVGVAVLQLAKLVAGLCQSRLFAIDPSAALYGLLHLVAQRRDAFASTGLMQILLLQSLLLVRSLGEYAAIWSLLPSRKLGRHPSGPCAKH